MIWRDVMLPVLAATVATGIAVLALGGNAAPVNSALLAQKSASPASVDVALALAVDVSYSMDHEEQVLQREGYIAAITSREFMNALRQGMHGKVAMTYFEWAGTHHNEVIVPWRLVEGPESADAFVAEIARAPYRRASRTSVAGALMFGASLIESSGYRGVRRVIDVSGDGANNNGPPVTIVRDEVVGKGITINGLPIMLKRPNALTMDIGELDVYYEDCVIGGPAAFVIPIKEREQFRTAIRTKLILEIAGLTPAPRVLQASAASPRVSCMIGERMWQQRWGN
jgi:hypothetical protein